MVLGVNLLRYFLKIKNLYFHLHIDFEKDNKVEKNKTRKIK